MAVLEKRLRLNFGQVDIYAKVGGGMKIQEPGMDLALVAAFSLALVGFCYVGRRHEMSRVNGVIFVVLYAAYIAASVLR